MKIILRCVFLFLAFFTAVVGADGSVAPAVIPASLPSAWEADLVSGSHHRGFLVTLVNRKTKYTLIGQVRHKQADVVCKEILRLLIPYRSVIHTITYDNGKEFSHHEAVSKNLEMQRIFPNPYHSWERG